MTLLSAVFSLMLFAPMGQALQEQSHQTVHVKGQVIAFHRKWRFPTAAPAFGSMALPADLWIVRIDSDASHPRYVLAKYEIYKTPLSDADIKKKLLLEGVLQPSWGASHEKNVFFSCVQKHMKERRRGATGSGESKAKQTRPDDVRPCCWRLVFDLVLDVLTCPLFLTHS